MTIATGPDSSTRHTLPAQEVLHFRVSPHAVQRILLTGVGLLVVAYLGFAINYNHLGLDFVGANILYQIFDMNGEEAIPTWYESSLLLAAALILAVIAAIGVRLGQRYRWHWAGLALVFLALSIDEAADLHGSVPFKLSDSFSLGGPLTYPWVIPGIAFTLLAGLLYRRFLLDLRAAMKRRLLLAGSLFVGGAVAMEVIEAIYASSIEATAPYLFMVAVEEALEMTGVIVFISALLAHAGSLAGEIDISITLKDETISSEV